MLTYLQNENKCVTADEIISALNNGEENVSKTTVYRCLEHFVSEGTVTRFTGKQGESSVYRFIGGHMGHFHLKCTSCGETTCVDCDFISNMEHHFLGHHGFKLDKTQTVFYGLCKNCRPKT